MQEYRDTNPEERTRIHAKAKNWFSCHEKHVKTLIKESSFAVCPSGSDMYKPELWKSIHWNWFFALHPSLKPQEVKKSWMNFSMPWRR